MSLGDRRTFIIATARTKHLMLQTSMGFMKSVSFKNAVIIYSRVFSVTSELSITK